MPFDLGGAVKKAAGGLADLGMEQSQQAIADLNLLLGLLQQAGYGVGQVDVEIGLPPKMTVNLKPSSAVSEDKLNAILRDHSDKTMIVALVSSLLRANQLRGGIKVKNLALAEIQMVLTTSPQLVMSWKETPTT